MTKTVDPMEEWNEMLMRNYRGRDETEEERLKRLDFQRFKDERHKYYKGVGGDDPMPEWNRMFEDPDEAAYGRWKDRDKPKTDDPMKEWSEKFEAASRDPNWQQRQREQRSQEETLFRDKEMDKDFKRLAALKRRTLGQRPSLESESSMGLGEILDEDLATREEAARIKSDYLKAKK